MTPPEEDKIIHMSKQVASVFALIVSLCIVDPMILCAILLWWIAFIK